MAGEPRISVRPDRDGRRVRIVVGRRTVARIMAADVARLGITDGMMLTEAMQHRLDSLAAVEKAKKAALSLLKRKPYSRKELSERLCARAHAPEAVESVLDALEEQGAINERVFAETIVFVLTRKKPASEEFLRARLSARGIRPSVIEEVLAAKPTDERSELAVLVDSVMPSLASLEAQVAARRLAGRLSRRGYDAETVREVIASRFPGLEGGDL